MQEKNKFDPYLVHYTFADNNDEALKDKNEGNGIKFLREDIVFPFNARKLYKTLRLLYIALKDDYAGATNLASYPQRIFEETELKNYPELAKWVYNIIETWIAEIEKIPAKHNPRLFDSFLKICEDLALKAKNIDTGKDAEVKVTLKTIYNEDQLKKLFIALMAGKYIAENTKENDFIYIFSGKTIDMITRIKWKESKKKAIYLLDKICNSFSFDTVNNCIESKFKSFDYNDRPITGYSEIDNILKTLRPINATP